MKKYFILVVIIILILTFKLFEMIDRGNYKNLPYLSEPIQINLDIKQREKFYEFKLLDNWAINCIPVAKYEISAVVMSKMKYFYGIDGKFVPYDLALVWGDLYNKEKYKFLHVYQFTRHAYWHFGNDAPLDEDYVISHFANVHIIPDNKHIYNQIKKLKKGDEIYLRGYLVNIDGFNNKNNKMYSRKTSLTRDDIGDGACEVLLVKEILWHRP